MKTLEDSYNVDIKFEKLLDFLESDQLPEVEGLEKLEFISNRFEQGTDHILLNKTILFPLHRKYRGVFSTLLGINKIRVVYDIKYDETNILITVKNPDSIKSFVQFTSQIFIEDNETHIKINKKIEYTNKISSNGLVSMIAGNIEDDFFEQMDMFTDNMFEKCR